MLVTVTADQRLYPGLLEGYPLGSAVGDATLAGSDVVAGVGVAVPVPVEVAGVGVWLGVLVTLGVGE